MKTSWIRRKLHLPFLVAKYSRADVGQWTKCYVQKTLSLRGAECRSVTLIWDSVWLIIICGVGESRGEGRTRGGAGLPSQIH